MTGTRDAFEQLRSTLAEVPGSDEAARLTDDELLAAMGGLEALGRLVDAHRAAFAGEVAERCRVELGEQRLSTRRGCRSAVELVERVTQVSAFEARRRIVLGSATRARSGLSGEPIGAVFPLVAAALATGDLGADAACTIDQCVAPCPARALGADVLAAAAPTILLGPPAAGGEVDAVPVVVGARPQRRALGLVVLAGAFRVARRRATSCADDAPPCDIRPVPCHHLAHGASRARAEECSHIAIGRHATGGDVADHCKHRLDEARRGGRRRRVRRQPPLPRAILALRRRRHGQSSSAPITSP